MDKGVAAVGFEEEEEEEEFPLMPGEELLPDDIDYDFVVPSYVESTLYEDTERSNKRIKVLRERRKLLREGLSLEPLVDRLRDPDDEERSLLRRPDLQRRQREVAEGNPITPGANFDVIQGEEMLRRRGFLRGDWAIHDQRAQHDPMYALLYCPHARVRLYNPQTGETTTVRYIDKVCDDCMTWIEMHYNWNDVIKNDKRTQKAFKILRTTTNTRIKLFAILAFMSWAPRIKQHLASLYNDQSHRSRKDFERAAQAAFEMIEVTRLKSSVHRPNIYQTVKTCIRAVSDAYLRPPGFMVAEQHQQHHRRRR